MKEIKNQAFVLHIMALVVPAVLEAFSKSGSPVLMIVAQLGAVMFNAITSLHMSAPALPNTGLVAKIPDVQSDKKPEEVAVVPVAALPAPVAANIQIDAQPPVK